MFWFYLYYDDEPLYLEFDVDSRSSFSQVHGINMERVANMFMNQIDRQDKAHEEAWTRQMHNQIKIAIILDLIIESGSNYDK